MTPHISRIIPPNYSNWQTIENTYQVCRSLIYQNIPGDFVECGVASGSNFGAMLLAAEDKRACIGYDSFEGIPWAGVNDDQQPGIGKIDRDKIGLLESSGVSSHTKEDVLFNIRKWGLKGNYMLIKGWFQDTIPNNIIFNIACLRLDGDLYESTAIPLKYLLPKVSKGGIVIIDDWNLVGARLAWSEVEIDYVELKELGEYGPKYFKIL